MNSDYTNLDNNHKKKITFKYYYVVGHILLVIYCYG